MKNKYYWAVGIFTIFVLLVSAYARSTFLLGGGGGANHEVPDTVISGEPAVIGVTLSTWGGGGAISGRYTDITLGYRLVGDSEYRILAPESVALAQNYLDAMKQDKPIQYEAHKFTIPPYPEGTTGEIEYYLDTTLDGQANHQLGIKNIILINRASTTVSALSPEELSGGESADNRPATATSLR